MARNATRSDERGSVEYGVLQTVPLWDDAIPDGSFTLDLEDRLDPWQWVVLVRWEDCPGCKGIGVEWGGDGPVDCRVCQGSSFVPFGVGGAYLTSVERYDCPDDPGVECFRGRFRDAALSGSSERGSS